MKVRVSLRLHGDLSLTSHSEVENIIKVSVDEAVQGNPSLLSHGNVLVSRLVEALESDMNWVETYRVTGELDIRGAPEGDSELEETLTLVKQVRIT